MKPNIITITFLVIILSQVNMSHANNSITIYSGKHQGHLNQNQLQNVHNIPGFAVVKQTRTSQFQKGQFTLAFDDVAEHIDPTTVSFSTPNNPSAATVLDQNFQFDLVGTDKLLQKYIDQIIHVNHNQGDQSIESSGTLLSTQGGITLQTESGSVITISTWNHINFPNLPGGLLTKPTLVWLLDSNSNNQEMMALSYQTQGMTWWADYNITLLSDTENCELDLSSWVSIVNKSGASFADTQLKLIAGDVNRVQNNRRSQPMVSDSLVKSANAQNFTEQSLFEYHLYKLPRSIDLPNNSTKQIQLMNRTNGINCERKLVFNATGQRRINYHRPITDKGYWAQTEAKIEALLSFHNNTKNQLGVPMPAGRVRVNMADATDGSIEFIGEDNIEHTPKNDKITLKLGHAFDVKGKRVQRNFELTKSGLIEQIEITINNQKDNIQQVEIIEPMFRWSNWKVTQHDEAYKKLDASNISFVVKVPAETAKSFKYTVQYNWPTTNKQELQ